MKALIVYFTKTIKQMKNEDIVARFSYHSFDVKWNHWININDTADFGTDLNFRILAKMQYK